MTNDEVAIVELIKKHPTPRDNRQLSLVRDAMVVYKTDSDYQVFGALDQQHIAYTQAIMLAMEDVRSELMESLFTITEMVTAHNTAITSPMKEQLCTIIGAMATETFGKHVTTNDELIKLFFDGGDLLTLVRPAAIELFDQLLGTTKCSTLT